MAKARFNQALMETFVEFRSKQFPPYEGEFDKINPGRFGKRLAEFLQGGQSSMGFPTSDLIPEDWGWIFYVEGRCTWVGCGNYDQYPPDAFLCFIEPGNGITRRFFRRIDVSDRVISLCRAVDQVLSTIPDVTDMRWTACNQSYPHRQSR